jgi:hypothetical protein
MVQIITKSGDEHKAACEVVRKKTGMAGSFINVITAVVFCWRLRANG